MTLKEAIFRLANINNELEDLSTRLDRYVAVPISVNGLEQDVREDSAKMQEVLVQYENLVDEYISLQNMVNKAKMDNGISSLTIEVNEKRKYLRMINALINLNHHYSSKKLGTFVESFGIVKYDTLNREELLNKEKTLKEEVEKLSTRIDNLTSTVELY